MDFYVIGANDKHVQMCQHHVENCSFPMKKAFFCTRVQTKSDVNASLSDSQRREKMDEQHT